MSPYDSWKLTALVNEYRQACADLSLADDQQRQIAQQRLIELALSLSDYVSFDLEPWTYVLTPAGQRAIQEVSA
jgi:hypothetical protein